MFAFKKISLAIAATSLNLFSIMVIAEEISASFHDVSSKVGLSTIKGNKYWSPVIADLNRDGYYDLILANHSSNRQKGAKHISPEMYWGSSAGFVPFKHRKNIKDRIPTGGADFHGFSAGYFGNKDDNPDLIFTVGGRRGSAGNLPIAIEFIGGKDDYILRMDENRKDSVVPSNMLELGIDGFGRGRSSFFIDIDHDGDLDLVYNSHGPKKGTVGKDLSDSKFIYEWKNNKFNRVNNIGPMKDNSSGMAAMADINHDGRLDLLYFEGSKPLECWISQEGSFRFILDNSFLPTTIKGVAAIAEIDYDGDGDFDLYIAGSIYDDKPSNDYLLEWDEKQKKYSDVSRSAGIPEGGMHRGVSVGDFDNNGYTDIFLGRATKDKKRLPDLLLLNNGDKTFKADITHGATIIADGEDGDQSEPFDFNNDGFLDILSGSKYGPWRLFQNSTAQRFDTHLKGKTSKNNVSNSHYVTVQVGRANDNKRYVPLGAAVTVVAHKKNETHKVIRRVGSQGQSHGQSFIDTLHFGLGKFDRISEIIVDYGTHREVTTFNNTQGEANRTYAVGDFPSPK